MGLDVYVPCSLARALDLFSPSAHCFPPSKRPMGFVSPSHTALLLLPCLPHQARPSQSPTTCAYQHIVLHISVDTIHTPAPVHQRVKLSRYCALLRPTFERECRSPSPSSAQKRARHLQRMLQWRMSTQRQWAIFFSIKVRFASDLRHIDPGHHIGFDQVAVRIAVVRIERRIYLFWSNWIPETCGHLRTEIHDFLKFVGGCSGQFKIHGELFENESGSRTVRSLS
jgi:hypothetical protein